MLAGDARPGFGRAPPCDRLEPWRWRLLPRVARGFWGIGSRRARATRNTCVERTSLERNPLMNPADVAQSALPLASSDVSLIALFLQAHWVVKAVMLGLLACSVWVWAIAIDKMFLYSRTKRAMD